MKRTTLCIMLLLAGAAGCGASNSDVATGEPSKTIPVSDQSAQMLPGLTAWKFYQAPEGLEVLGVDGQDHILVRTNLHQRVLDGQGTWQLEFVSDLPTSSILRLTIRGDDQLLGHELIGPPSEAVGQLVHDLSGAPTPYLSGCALATAAVLLACGAAVLEEGINPVADAYCIDAWSAYWQACGSAQ